MSRPPHKRLLKVLAIAGDAAGKSRWCKCALVLPQRHNLRVQGNAMNLRYLMLWLAMVRKSWRQSQSSRLSCLNLQLMLAMMRAIHLAARFQRVRQRVRQPRIRPLPRIPFMLSVFVRGIAAVPRSARCDMEWQDCQAPGSADWSQRIMRLVPEAC